MAEKEMQPKAKEEAPAKAERVRPGRVFVPAVDIYETPEALVLVADMPGVAGENVSLDLKENLLVIQGRVKTGHGARGDLGGTRINVEVSRSRRDRDADAFTISYQDRDPELTMRVANGLATFFIDENLKVRETQAVGTSDFLEAELESTRVRLEQVEKGLQDYRLKTMGELPEQFESNLRILDRLNAQLLEKEQSLRSARTSLTALENETVARQSVMEAAAAPAGAKEGEDAQTLDQLKDRLASLLASYTEQQPDVVRLKARIEKLWLSRLSTLDFGKRAMKRFPGCGSA